VSLGIGLDFRFLAYDFSHALECSESSFSLRSNWMACHQAQSTKERSTGWLARFMGGTFASKGIGSAAALGRWASRPSLQIIEPSSAQRRRENEVIECRLWVESGQFSRAGQLPFRQRRIFSMYSTFGSVKPSAMGEPEGLVSREVAVSAFHLLSKNLVGVPPT
jgi:hypothetical protein